MKLRPLYRSFADALRGIMYVWKTQRNMRIHFTAAYAALASGFFLGLSRVELLFVLFAVVLVLVAEMLNTAIEAAVDLAVREYNPLARAAKHVAAGAVLISAVNAVIVGVMVFREHLPGATMVIMDTVRQQPRIGGLVGAGFFILLVSSLREGLRDKRESGGSEDVEKAS